jgi:50S ribosomal protein L16 3-hydroxylase
MLEFAQDALQDALQDSQALARGLGEYLTEPKPHVWFETRVASAKDAQTLKTQGIRLDRRTRMMFDAHHVFINGESFSASGRDAAAMRVLANERALAARDVRSLSSQALVLVSAWWVNGWLQALE